MPNLTPSLQKDLTSFAASHNMSLREMAQLIDMIINRESILSQHQSPISQNDRDKRWRTRLPNGKQVVKTHREDLENAVIAYYSDLADQSETLELQDNATAKSTAYCRKEISPTKLSKTDDCTLKTLYPQWLELRKYEVCKNTLADDLRNWNTYIAPSEIADIPLNQLGRSKLKAWASRLVTEYSMKKKYFDNIRTVVNSMLDFAVDEEYIEVNKLKGIKLNNHLFKPTTFKEEQEEVFTEQEQQLVMQEAEKDSQDNDSALPLGICILFLTGLRVGELCALRYGDIKENKLYVQSMVVEKQIETADGLKGNGYEVVEHAKSSAGRRTVILTKQAQGYLEKIKEINQRNGYPISPDALIFQRKSGLCNQRVFDSRLKKYCNPHHLNLPFAKSCHDVRRTYISNLFDLGINPDTIRRMAGHENIEMTMKYCRGRISHAELANILEKGFTA